MKVCSNKCTKSTIDLEKLNDTRVVSIRYDIYVFLQFPSFFLLKKKKKEKNYDLKRQEVKKMLGREIDDILFTFVKLWIILNDFLLQRKYWVLVLGDPMGVYVP